MIEKVLLLLEEKAKEDEQLKEALANFEQNKKSNEVMHSYLVKEARKHLNGKSGGIDSDTVLGWAIHYATEKNENLDIPLKGAESLRHGVKPKKAEIKKPKVEVKKPKVEKTKPSVVQLDLFDGLF